MTKQLLAADRDAWSAARQEHLEAEKEFTRQRDALSAARRELPWLKITEQYRFEGPTGSRTLRELFDGHSQLAVYHFMFGAGWEEGCPSCSFWADNYNGIEAHLAARDTRLVTVSLAPLAELAAYKQRMEWNFDWYSSAGTSFNFDMGVSFRPEQVNDGTLRYNHGTQPAFGEEAPGISIFNLTDDGDIGLSYQAFSRGLDMINGAYHILDLTPKGRDEADLPWTMAWLQRHDSY